MIRAVQNIDIGGRRVLPAGETCSDAEFGRRVGETLQRAGGVVYSPDPPPEPEDEVIVTKPDRPPYDKALKEMANKAGLRRRR